MFRLTALGAGSAFTGSLNHINWQTNFLIERSNEDDEVIRMLIDCGTHAQFSLMEKGLSPLDIDAVYVSHAHADHIGGLEWLGYRTFFDPSYKRGFLGLDPRKRFKGEPKHFPLLFAENRFSYDLWDESLKGGMKGLEGEDATLEFFFKVHRVKRNQLFQWGGIYFNIVQAVHVSAGYNILDSYGLMFTTPGGKRVFITTDVQFAPETSMKAYYQEADLIIHDCETAPFESGVHAHYDRLRTLPDETKAKMKLIHYQMNVDNDFDAWEEKAKSAGFMGIVRKGETILMEEF